MANLIKIPENENINLDTMLNLYLDPLYIYMPITKKDNYKLNNYLYKNTNIENNKTSISGKINGAKKVIVNNKEVVALEIKNDFKENVKERINKINIKNKEDLENILKLYNLTNIIDKIDNKEEYLVITCALDSGYNYNEVIILNNYYRKLCKLINDLLKILNINQAILAIKNTSYTNIKNIKSIIGTYPNIQVKLLMDNYLVSYDKFLCQELNISLDKTIILNITDIYKIYTIFKTNMLNETFLSISGDAIQKSMVIKTKLGTSIKEILDKFITITEPDYTIYINGILKGREVSNLDDYIVCDDLKYIVINKRQIIKEEECFNCGACYKVCPSNINVLKCYLENKKNNKCIGCGLCNYVCPANIKLKEKIYGDIDEKKKL